MKLFHKKRLDYNKKPEKKTKRLRMKFGYSLKAEQV